VREYMVVMQFEEGRLSASSVNYDLAMLRRAFQNPETSWKMDNDFLNALVYMTLDAPAHNLA
jgi:hypothetical protein